MKILHLIPLVFILFFLSNCSKLNEVSVSSRNFEDVIEQTQNLVFTFNKDLVSDSDLDTWTSENYLDFSPKLNGKFKWTAKNELVFSPAVGFDPATDYKAELNKNLLKKADKKFKLGGDDAFNFHTPYLNLANSEAFWGKNRNENQAVLKLKLNFNYPVNSSDLAKNLKFSQDDKSLNYTILPNQNSDKVLVVLNDLNKENSAPISAEIASGLKMSNSTFTTKETIKSQIEIPSKELEIQDVQTGFQNNKGFIKIRTNQELKPENLDKFFEINSSQKADNQQVTQEVDSLGNPIKSQVQSPKSKENKIETKAEITENGFIIHGDFNETDNYVLTIKKGLEGVLNQKLSDDFTKDLFFGEMPANIAFANKKAIYLSSKGFKNIGINLVNIPKIQVKIAKIYENNILQFMKQNRSEDYNYSEDGGESKVNGYNYQNDDQEAYSDVVVNKKIETQNLPKVRGISVLNLNLPDQNNRKGIYLVSVNGNDEYYQQASQIVSISDIGLITKQAANELLVFANSIKTADAMKGVEITLVSSNNQTIISEKTDGDGVIIFKDLKEKLGNFKVAMITAKTEDDFNYLLFDGSQVETSRYEVEGKRDNSSGFDAFVYGDRNIYRPGETIYFNTVIRQDNWESVGKIPVKIRLLMPNGKEFSAFRKETNEQGAVETSVPLDKSAVTGTYTIEIYNGNDVLLTSKNISIEEFMPDRIKVDVKTDKEFYKSGENINLTATALNLFGPPASDRNYEMSFQLSRKVFSAKNYPNYTFDIANATKFGEDQRQGKTDQQGLATEQFQIPTTYQDMGVLEAKMFVTVFDESSRPVNRLKRLDVFTQPVFYGLGMNETYIGTNAPVKIPMVALNKDGKPVSATAEVEIVKFDYQTVVEKQNDQLKYTSKKQTKILYHRSVNFTNGAASISYVPTLSGEYEVRVYRAGATSWTGQSFYAYGWGNTQNSSFEVNNEGKVEIEFDKEKYEVGDKAKVLFKTPFSGKLLVTVERNSVLEHHFIKTDKKSAELTLKLDDAHLPNVYVSATLIRPMDDSNLPLTVAHGYAPLTVEKPSTKLPIEIVSVEKSRSNTKQKITVKTGKANAEVTLAVVDEGILQIKNYATPDIFNYFYQKRALEVSSYDIYPFLFPELSISGTSSVGGDGYNLEKRINPLSNGRVKLVAFWSGILKTNGDGEATFEVNIPQFSGDLRVMAVAYKDKAFGSANKSMKVADPIVISTALPRFLSPNDEITVPVNLTNTTKQTANVTVSASLSGNLNLIGTNTQTLTIAPEKEARTQFSVKANAAIGSGTVTILVNGLKEKFTDKTEISIRPPASLLKTSSSGVIAGGQSATVNFANDYIPSSVSSSLIISKSPMVEFVKHYQNLLGYPYGCVEQTVSKAFPQLYFSEFVKQIQSPKKVKFVSNGASDFNPNTNVQVAIKRLEMMQTYNGGLSMWQTGEKDYWWGTAYACHFIIEAQKAGFEVNSTFFGKVLDYLTTQTNKQGMTEMDTWHNADGSRTVKKIAKREMVYSLYVLAAAGKANRSVMNYYKSNMDLLSPDEKFMLAAAFNLIGDTKSFNAILPKNYNEDRSEKSTGEDLSSPIRNVALSLNTLIDTDPNNLQVPALARQLSQALRATPYLSTQESAFAFLALGKLAKKANQTNMTASVFSNGKSIGNFTGKDLVLSQKVDNQVIITTNGKGSLYYFAQTEGLSASGKYVEEDKILQVRRTFLDRNGNKIGTTFKQNQLIVVKITLQSMNGLDVKNVVITDLLPAGLEIENPRITPERELAWIKDQSVPEHFDIRDDRINYFTEVGKTAKTFYYLVRAVSKGKYVLGPVSADAMYNGEFRSYNGGGSVVVE